IDLVLDDRAIDLIEEGIDLGLRIDMFRDASLTVRRVATCRRLVLGTPAYFERFGIPITPPELIRHPAIIYTDEIGPHTYDFRQGTSQVPVSLSGRLRVSATEGMRASVLGSMGLAIASEWMFMPELSSGAVRPVLTEWALPPAHLWAAFPTG